MAGFLLPFRSQLNMLLQPLITDRLLTTNDSLPHYYPPSLPPQQCLSISEMFYLFVCLLPLESNP